MFQENCVVSQETFCGILQISQHITFTVVQQNLSGKPPNWPQKVQSLKKGSVVLKCWSFCQKCVVFQDRRSLVSHDSGFSRQFSLYLMGRYLLVKLLVDVLAEVLLPVYIIGEDHTSQCTCRATCKWVILLHNGSDHPFIHISIFIKWTLSS